MKSNLALIEEAANAALDTQRARPMLVESVIENASKASTRLIAGFEVTDPSAEQEALEKGRQNRREAMAEFSRSRGVLREKLERAKITPLATIPKTAFDHICSRSGLFRLTPDKDGTITVSLAAVDKIEKDVDFNVETITILGWLLTTILGAVIGAVISSPDLGSRFAGGFLGLIGSGIIGGGIIWPMIHAILKPNFRQNAIRQFTNRPHAEILKDLFPDGMNPKPAKEGVGKTTLILPTPPEDVARILIKAREFSLQVAAVPDAISFAESPEQIIRKEIGKREEARRLERLLADPIIYLEYGNAVAVIAQFGDFPIEQSIVNEVVNSAYLV